MYRITPHTCNQSFGRFRQVWFKKIITVLGISFENMKVIKIYEFYLQVRNTHIGHFCK
jgi:hypothetical protein